MRRNSSARIVSARASVSFGSDCAARHSASSAATISLGDAERSSTIDAPRSQPSASADRCGRAAPAVPPTAPPGRREPATSRQPRPVRPIRSGLVVVRDQVHVGGVHRADADRLFSSRQPRSAVATDADILLVDEALSVGDERFRTKSRAHRCALARGRDRRDRLARFAARPCDLRESRLGRSGPHRRRRAVGPSGEIVDRYVRAVDEAATNALLRARVDA